MREILSATSPASAYILRREWLSEEAHPVKRADRDIDVSEGSGSAKEEKIFEDKKVRVVWNKDTEERLFSVVDVIAVLTDSPRPKKYWNALKTKLDSEGSELSQNLGQLKLLAEDGKMRETDVLDTRGVLRLIRSVPSPKAEPFKLWLAEVGNDRPNEIADPERAILRGADFYRKKGHPEGWMNQRPQSIEMRKELTDE